MFTNLHTLPIGESLYTLFVGQAPHAPDEIDFRAPKSISLADLLELARAKHAGEYLEGTVVYAIVDNSTGDWVFHSGIEWGDTKYGVIDLPRYDGPIPPRSALLFTRYEA